MKIAGHPGLKVTLQVNGAELQEYLEEQGGTMIHRQVTNYVEAISGSAFSIHVAHPRPVPSKDPSDRLACNIYLDGKHAMGLWIKTPSYVSIAGAEKVENDAYVFRPFQFASLTTAETTNGLSQSELKEKFKGIGEVEVDFIWQRKDGPLRQERSRPKNTSFASDSVVPEKALKGRSISNLAKLGDAVKTGRQVDHRPSRQTTFPYGSQPFAKFIFQYRSRQDLHNEHIIPRSSSPVSLEDRDPDTLTLEEARELIRRNKARLDARAQVQIKSEKRERSTLDEHASGAARAEGSQRKRQRTSRDPEVIDLCDD